jgi:hypothetical protein
MEAKKLENLLLSYETDVRFPDVSGMEHIEMLLNRTEIEKQQQLLSAEQQERLIVADQQLAAQATVFYAAIDQIADLGAWREKVDPPASHWWWYLDVLASAWPRLETAVSQPQAMTV